MNRRQLLAAGAALGAAVTGGCVGCATAPALSLSMETTSEDDITNRLTEPIDPGSDDHRIAIEAIEGPATATATSEPFDSETPYRYDERVYTAETTVIEETPGTSFGYAIDPIDGDEPIDSGDRIAYEELPDVDEEAFADRGWDGQDPFLGYRASVHYLEENVGASVLVPDPEYGVIVWPETRGRFEITDRADQPLKTYEYTAEVAADPAAEYGREVRRLVEFELGPLDDDSRAVVEEAIAEPPYTVPNGAELSEAETAVVDRFRGTQQVRRLDGPPRDSESASGRYVTRHEDRLYWVEIVAYTG